VEAVLLWTSFVALALVAVVREVSPAGAAVIGWPLLWSVPLLPLRVLDLLDPDSAFAVGLPLQLAANAVTIVATAYAGLYASGRRGVGLGAAALFAFWPLLTRPLAGGGAWENGQWHVDVGLHLYTEPISTALVAVAVALLLSPRIDGVRLALAGAALGFATVVKVSNGFVGAAAVAILAWTLGLRRALPLALGGLAFLPLVAVYWPKGYPEIPNVPTFSGAHVGRNWTDSLIFHPTTLAILLPLAVVGALVLRPLRVPALLGAAVLANAAFYSFYEVTYLHPRFLFASLPALFVLQSAGAAAVLGWLSPGRGR
jgi:hypothetical protein